MSNNENDNSVGYGKPPKHSRFRPGKSGNPKGRPKGAKSFVGLLVEELCQKVRTTENGKTQYLTKEVVMIKQLVNKAMKGDASALKEIMKLKKELDEKVKFNEDGVVKSGVLVVEGKMEINEWYEKYKDMKLPEIKDEE